MPTLRPTSGDTGCVVETGLFKNTWDGSTSTGACFQKGGTCLSWWYWDTPVNVKKFNIRSHYYYPNSSIYLIWGRVNGSWVELWTGEWMPAHATWDSKAISCNNCDGILIGQRHVSQPSRPCITEVTVDYTVPPPPEEGKASIISTGEPDSFTPGVEFRVRPTITNVGGDDTLVVKLINRDTGSVLDEQDITVSSGRNWVPSMYVTLTQTTDFHGSIEAGHIEIGNVVVDDTEDFTIPAIVCSEGDREILERCWDGSVKRERRCENGQWREYEYTCPPEPPPPPPTVCTEGDRETLEYCPDGSVKRERVCENNDWREYTYDCPPEPEICYEGDREILEWCPDGYTVKRERICENGKWREYTYDCPPEPEICYEGDREVLEFCPDGYTVKRERVCENGKWREYTYDCPPAPPPEERIIDMILRRIQEFRESLGW